MALWDTNVMSILVIAGSAIFVFLGIAHGVFTFQSTPSFGPMTPTDKQVQAAMAIPGGLGMAPDMDSTLWKAWVGFNLSHALGVVLSGAVIGAPAIVDFQSALGNPGWLATALVLPPTYLAISRQYWFEKPTQAITLGSALVIAGVIGGLVTS